MKFLVTGVNGQLGYDLMRELKRRSLQAIGSGSRAEGGVAPYVQMDICDGQGVERVITEQAPDAVIHCAAWTAVDAAEESENYRKVMAVNAEGTANIAKACNKQGCKMIYISTDYVFNGQGTEPWKPDDKSYAPLNVYGESKLAGELAVVESMEKYFIVRTAWVYGINGGNFVKTMLALSEKYPRLRVVSDQIGTPTYTPDLARLLVDMAMTEKYGYYHATNEGGFISWYDFAEEIFKQAGKEVQVQPVSTEEYGMSKARRPFNSRLDKAKLAECGLEPLPDWKDALERYMRELESKK